MKSKYQNLIVWQKSIKLVTNIYQLTKKFKKEELYGLTSQMRRYAISIPSNIAEGAERNSSKEFKHFLSISKGSAAELETQIIIATKLNYITEENSKSTKSQIYEILKMLGSLIRKL